MVLRRIYTMCLEHPGSGFMSLCKMSSKDLDLFTLRVYIDGYVQSEKDTELPSSKETWMDFDNWLRLNGLFPNEGWCQSIIDEVGNGVAAFERFRAHLYAYLESEKPQWFIDFNLKKQPSPSYRVVTTEEDSYKNAKSSPVSYDIRDPKHIIIAKEKNA